jgi:hypothetical protein
MSVPQEKWLPAMKEKDEDNTYQTKRQNESRHDNITQLLHRWNI